jgi:hypothetical protein
MGVVGVQEERAQSLPHAPLLFGQAINLKCLSKKNAKKKFVGEVGVGVCPTAQAIALMWA